MKTIQYFEDKRFSRYLYFFKFCNMINNKKKLVLVTGESFCVLAIIVVVIASAKPSILGN